MILDRVMVRCRGLVFGSPSRPPLSHGIPSFLPSHALWLLGSRAASKISRFKIPRLRSRALAEKACKYLFLVVVISQGRLAEGCSTTTTTTMAMAMEGWEVGRLGGWAGGEPWRVKEGRRAGGGRRRRRRRRREHVSSLVSHGALN
jgi:hypothetical protein